MSGDSSELIPPVLPGRVYTESELGVPTPAGDSHSPSGAVWKEGEVK